MASDKPRIESLSESNLFDPDVDLEPAAAPHGWPGDAGAAQHDRSAWHTPGWGWAGQWPASWWSGGAWPVYAADQSWWNDHGQAAYVAGHAGWLSSDGEPADGDHGGSRVPVCRVGSNDEHLSVAVELPGVERDTITVEIDDGVLVVFSDPGAVDDPSEAPPVYYGTLELPANVDLEEVISSYANGLLTVRIGWASVPRPRKIKVD